MKRSPQEVARLAEEIKQGSRRALARGITLIESQNPEDEEPGQNLLEQVMPETGKALRLGISGVPGVGKSTFIEALGLDLIARGYKVAVLAVDPSSPYSGGSIMGDKTRMQQLTQSDSAYIRPSPTAGTLGGVARRTRESMLLCEAAGYDLILVETVGVGQSEYEVSDMVDHFMVMLLPGGGDMLQGIKKGIMEVADVLVINKAEGEQLQQARNARQEYQQALNLVSGNVQYPAEIMLCSAVEGTGLPEIWQNISERTDRQKQDGFFDRRRKQQLESWMRKWTEQTLLTYFWSNDNIRAEADELKRQLIEGRITPVKAGRELINRFLGVRTEEK